VLPVPGDGRGDVPGNLRRVVPAGGTLENLDHLQRRPGVIGQVEVCHREEASEGLTAYPVRAGEQGGLHAVVTLVEVIRELRISQHRQRQFRDARPVLLVDQHPRLDLGGKLCCGVQQCLVDQQLVGADPRRLSWRRRRGHAVQTAFQAVPMVSGQDQQDMVVRQRAIRNIGGLSDLSNRAI
jgi:hypothetical protein